MFRVRVVSWSQTASFLLAPPFSNVDAAAVGACDLPGASQGPRSTRTRERPPLVDDDTHHDAAHEDDMVLARAGRDGGCQGRTPTGTRHATRRRGPCGARGKGKGVNKRREGVGGLSGWCGWWRPYWREGEDTRTEGAKNRASAHIFFPSKEHTTQQRHVAWGSGCRWFMVRSFALLEILSISPPSFPPKAV